MFHHFSYLWFAAIALRAGRWADAAGK